MKKTWRIVSLVLVLTMLLTVGVVAAENKMETDKAIVKVEGAGATAYFSETNDEVITVTVTGSSIKAGKEHLVLMVKGTKDTYQINQESILYIDQKSAVGDASSGSVTFDVYPSAITDSVIVIINESGSIVAAIVEGKYVLGDVDDDGVVTASDAAMVLRAVAKIQTLDSQQTMAANVDGDSVVTASDAAKLLRVVAKIDKLN